MEIITARAKIPCTVEHMEFDRVIQSKTVGWGKVNHIRFLNIQGQFVKCKQKVKNIHVVLNVDF